MICRYETEDIAGTTHAGTHLDAPAHFSKGKWHVQDIPIRNLVGALVLVDISNKAAADPLSQLLVSDIARWEQTYGRIPPGAIVVMNSGWTARWPDKARYLGTITKNVSELKFPGFDPYTARWLVKNRQIHGVGVDTPSVDFGPSKDFAAHQVLGAANIFILENVAVSERLPPSGATIIAFPMKLAGLSGAPCRVAAMWGGDTVFLSGGESIRQPVTVSFVIGLLGIARLVL